jgi:hypothetical protein
MPEDYTYDSIEPIVMFYKKKFRPSDGVESTYQLVTLMLVTKVYTGDKNLPLAFTPLPKILIELRILLGDLKIPIDADFLPVVSLFMKEYVVPLCSE